MLALDVMTTAVISVTPETTVRDAAKILAEHGISGMPVLDARGHLAGMLSEGDLIRRAEIDTVRQRRSWWLDRFSTGVPSADYVKAYGQTVADVMTTDVAFVDDTATLGEVATMMEMRHVKRVPVLKEGRLVGIVSRANLVQALASAPDEAPPVVPASDREIRATLMGELAGQPWAFSGRNIVVRDGVVHLWGIAWTDDAVKAMRVAVRGVPGVKGFVDHTERYPAFQAL